MRIAAHGIEIELPRGWDGRIYRVRGSDPILHAANFRLPTADGDFGSGATARMLPGAAFLALKEYRPGPRLVPGHGLFASREVPLPLQVRRFHPRTLQVGRHGQAGFQHFFTHAGRPFCLYAVIRTVPVGEAVTARAEGQLGEINRALSSLRIHQRR
jgi:hypothetical protein